MRFQKKFYILSNTFDNFSSRVFTASSGVNSTLLPLQVYFSEQVNDTYRWKVSVGTVANLMPTIDTIPLDDELSFFTTSKYDERFVWLKLLFDDKYSDQPYEVQVICDWDETKEDVYEDEAFIKVAKINDKEVSNYLTSSLQVQFCSPRLLFWQS